MEYTPKSLAWIRNLGDWMGISISYWGAAVILLLLTVLGNCLFLYLAWLFFRSEARAFRRELEAELGTQHREQAHRGHH